MSSDTVGPTGGGGGGGGGAVSTEKRPHDSRQRRDRDSRHRRRGEDDRKGGHEDDRAEDDEQGEVDRYGRHRPGSSRDGDDGDEGSRRASTHRSSSASRSSHRRHRRRSSLRRFSHRRSSRRSPSRSLSSPSSPSHPCSHPRSRTPPSSRSPRSSSPPSSSRSRSRSPRRHRRTRRPRTPPKFDPRAVEEALKAATRSGPPLSLLIPFLPSTPFSPFPFPAVSSPASAEASLHLQLTRSARRLFVGNLPSAAGLSEAQLTVFFTLTAQSLGIITPQPVLSSWLSADAAYGFVEFRAVLDATQLLAALEKAPVQMMGRVLRVARPADYQPPPPALLHFEAAAPLHLLTAMHSLPFTLQPNAPQQSAALSLPPQVAQLLSSVVAPASSTTCTEPSPLLASSSNVSAPPTPPPSRVLLLLYLVTPADLDADDWEELVADIRQEVEQYGELQRLLIPRGEGVDANVLGRTFLHYQRLDAAQRAKQALHGRAFSGRTIDAREYDEAAFARGDLSL